MKNIRKGEIKPKEEEKNLRTCEIQCKNKLKSYTLAILRHLFS